MDLWRRSSRFRSQPVSFFKFLLFLSLFFLSFLSKSCWLVKRLDMTAFAFVRIIFFFNWAVKYSYLFPLTWDHVVEMISIYLQRAGTKLYAVFDCYALLNLCLGFQALIQFQLRQSAVSARNSLQVCSFNCARVLFLDLHWLCWRSLTLFNSFIGP